MDGVKEDPLIPGRELEVESGFSLLVVSGLLGVGVVSIGSPEDLEPPVAIGAGVNSRSLLEESSREIYMYMFNSV